MISFFENCPRAAFQGISQQIAFLEQARPFLSAPTPAMPATQEKFYGLPKQKFANLAAGTRKFKKFFILSRALGG
jgi:hypothetical protein